MRIRALIGCIGLFVACSAPTSLTPPPTQISTAPPITAPSGGANPSAAPTPEPTMPSPAALAAELRNAGELRTCLAVVGAPGADLDDNGKLVGYNVSFAEEIARRLNLHLDTREPIFDTLIDLVSSHECDMSVSSQNITADRLAQVDFVPYSKSIQPVLVAGGNPLHIATLADLCGQPVSATDGTTHIDLVNGTGDYAGQGLNASCSAAGKQPIDLHTYQADTGAVTALLSGGVVAYLGNPNFAAQYPGEIEYSDATLPPARQGITSAKDRPAVNAAIAVTLAAMIADGTYRAILIQHLPNDESVRIVSITE